MNLEDCGTGAGGFKEGNTCASSKESIPSILYHGTKAIFDKFSTAFLGNDIGFHFGTKEQADWRVGDGGTIKAYKVKIEKPLRLKDMGAWYGEKVVEQVNKAIGSKLHASASTSAIRNAIQNAGYDGVVYNNKFEGEGDSYIAFSPDQITEYSSKENKINFDSNKCPLATQDIKTNLANRQKAIDVAHYGPANPKEPNEEYWTAKAKIFGGSVKEAKTMRCGNCAGFNQTTKLTDCISKGIGSDAQEVEQAGDLGYCEIFDFKCASLRTCDAWIVGGPITDKTNLEQLKADLLSLKEQGATLLYDPSQARDESGKWTSQGGDFKSKLIEKAQKENSALDMAKSSVKGAIKGITAIASGARVAGQYGASKAYQIKNWLSSDDGQKFLHGVARIVSIGSKGTIEAIKSAHGDRYKILIGSLFNPELGAIIAGRSALKGFIRGAVSEYNKVDGGRQISNIVRKSIGIQPMSAQGNMVALEKAPDFNDIADYLADNIAVAIREEIEGKKIFEVATFAYDPSQARDQSGKWTSEGGQIMVSPNIRENMNYEEASKMLKSPEQARAVSIAKDLIDKQKISGKIESAIGDWEDGAENSVKIDVKGIKDFEQLAYTASKLGAMLNQKAVVAFQKKKDGPDILHKITADKPMDQVRKILSDNGISFRTMVGDRAKTSVTILDKGSQLTANVAKFLGAINGKSEAVRGIGEFIGGDTRIAGKKAYKGVIDNYERSFPNRVHLGLQRGRGRNYYRSYQAINFYDPSQPRDESGKWSESGSSVVAYHGTTKEAKEAIEKHGYDVKKSADGGMWLTTNKDAIVKKDVGASGHGDIVERIIDESSLKLGGWKEYDKYVTDQLISWGFDGLKLPDAGHIVYKIFFPEKLAKVIKKSSISKFETNFYDPSQKRDQSGKWTDGGGISKGATPTPRWAQDNPAEASKKTGEATTLYHGTSADVLKTIRKEGLKPSKSGVWGGGKVYSTDSLDLAMEYGVLRSGNAPKIGGKQLIGIISVLAEGFKSVADNIPTTKAQKMGKTGLAAVSKIFTKDGGVAPSAIKKMQIFEVDAIRKYVYENGPKPSPLATKELAEGSQLIYVPIVIQLPDDGSEGFQFDESVAIESFVFQYNGEKIEFYDPNQPRDEKGRWSGGGGIKSAKASTKAKQVSETSESKDGEDVDSMVKRLENEPKAKKAIADMHRLRQQTADREGISFDDASVTRWSLRDPSRYKQSKDIVETLRNPTPHHKEWINQQVKDGLNPNAKSDNPVAVILMGSPASGKTTTGRPFAEKILGGQQVTVIDPDSIKSKSHGFQGWNAGAFHDESAIIAEKMIMPRATQERHNMLIDITGQNSTKVSEMAKNLKALGYTIGVVHIDVDDKTALGRASQRFNKPNGRWVPYSYIKGASEKARNTWNKLTKENLIDIGYQVDGNVSRTKGEAPVKETYGKIFE